MIVIFYKINITYGIIYLIILIIYILFFDFFIKVYIIIQNKKWFICYSFSRKINYNNNIILKKLINLFSGYHNFYLI